MSDRNPFTDSLAARTRRFDRTRFLYLLATAFALACLALLASCSSSPPVQQPLHYVHQIHVAQEEIPCTDCHEGAEEADHATIPTGELCRDCHEDPIGESPEEGKLVSLLAEGDSIPWKRVHKLHEYVHFSHRRHVQAGRVLCETCHGDVAQRIEPFSRPYIDFNGPSGMQRCIDCHVESGNPRAGIDCALCHR